MPAYAQFLVLVIAVLGFWLLVLWPNQRRQREEVRVVEEFQHGLDLGQDVMLTSGIFGTVRSLDDSRVGLEIAPGTVVEVDRRAVVRRPDEPDLSAAESGHSAPGHPAPVDPTPRRSVQDEEN